jgi:CheY-like chemotaxis protein
MEPATLDVSFEEEAPRTIELPQQYADAPRQRVLLLDDREDYREVIEEYLVSRFYEVTSVGNGVEGIREIMKDAFDLIICDMMMPKLGGEMFYWAATRIRPAAGQRFIFFTGHKNDPTIQAFFERVNAVVLYKPFKLEALNAAMLEVLKKLR